MCFFEKKLYKIKKFQKVFFSCKENFLNKVPKKIFFRKKFIEKNSFRKKHSKANFFYKRYITNKFHKNFSKKFKKKI